MDMGPFYITSTFRPNPNQPTMLSQGPNPTHPPLHNNPFKGDSFQLNVANLKTQYGHRSYIGYNMNILSQTATLTATTITMIKFTWCTSNPTKLFDKILTQPNPWIDPIHVHLCHTAHKSIQKKDKSLKI